MVRTALFRNVRRRGEKFNIAAISRKDGTIRLYGTAHCTVMLSRQCLIDLKALSR